MSIVSYHLLFLRFVYSFPFLAQAVSLLFPVSSMPPFPAVRSSTVTDITFHLVPVWLNISAIPIRSWLGYAQLYPISFLAEYSPDYPFSTGY